MKKAEKDSKTTSEELYPRIECRECLVTQSGKLFAFEQTSGSKIFESSLFGAGSSMPVEVSNSDKLVTSTIMNLIRRSISSYSFSSAVPPKPQLKRLNKPPSKKDLRRQKSHSNVALSKSLQDLNYKNEKTVRNTKTKILGKLMPFSTGDKTHKENRNEIVKKETEAEKNKKNMGRGDTSTTSSSFSQVLTSIDFYPSKKERNKFRGDELRSPQVYSVIEGSKACKNEKVTNDEIKKKTSPQNRNPKKDEKKRKEKTKENKYGSKNEKSCKKEKSKPKEEKKDRPRSRHRKEKKYRERKFPRDVLASFCSKTPVQLMYATVHSRRNKDYHFKRKDTVGSDDRILERKKYTGRSIHESEKPRVTVTPCLDSCIDSCLEPCVDADGDTFVNTCKPCVSTYNPRMKTCTPCVNTCTPCVNPCPPCANTCPPCANTCPPCTNTCTPCVNTCTPRVNTYNPCTSYVTTAQDKPKEPICIVCPSKPIDSPRMIEGKSIDEFCVFKNFFRNIRGLYPRFSHLQFLPFLRGQEKPCSKNNSVPVIQEKEKIPKEKGEDPKVEEKIEQLSPQSFEIRHLTARNNKDPFYEELGKKKSCSCMKLVMDSPNSGSRQRKHFCECYSSSKSTLPKSEATESSETSELEIMKDDDSTEPSQESQVFVFGYPTENGKKRRKRKNKKKKKRCVCIICGNVHHRKNQKKKIRRKNEDEESSSSEKRRKKKSRKKRKESSSYSSDSTDENQHQPQQNTVRNFLRNFCGYMGRSPGHSLFTKVNELRYLTTCQKRHNNIIFPTVLRPVAICRCRSFENDSLECSCSRNSKDKEDSVKSSTASDYTNDVTTTQSLLEGMCSCKPQLADIEERLKSLEKKKPKNPFQLASVDEIPLPSISNQPVLEGEPSYDGYDGDEDSRKRSDKDSHTGTSKSDSKGERKRIRKSKRFGKRKKGLRCKWKRGDSGCDEEDSAYLNENEELVDLVPVRQKNKSLKDSFQSLLKYLYSKRKKNGKAELSLSDCSKSSDVQKSPSLQLEEEKEPNTPDIPDNPERVSGKKGSYRKRRKRRKEKK